MKKIGLSIIVSDRHEELDRAIQSAEGLYDYLSITLVHAKGLDLKQTEEVARKYNAIISHYHTDEKWKHSFIDDFGAARNIAWQGLPEDCTWVFLMDSDDILKDPKDARKMILKYEPNFVIFVRINNLLAHGSFLQQRIWMRGTARFKDRIHETLVYNKKLIKDYVETKIVIVHDSKTQEDSGKRNFIILKDVVGNGQASNRILFHYYEKVYIQEIKKERALSTRMRKAIKQFSLLTKKKDVSPQQRFRCHYFMADFYSMKAREEKGTFESAIAHIMECLKIEIDKADPYFLMGRLLYASGRFQESILWLNIAIGLPNHLTYWHDIKEFRTSMPHAQLALCYKALNKPKEAVQHHALARAYDKKFEKYDGTYFR
ncbi:MAG: hypothetical protein V3U54_13155 [Thermodesulfobacteriota bacterium]